MKLFFIPIFILCYINDSQGQMFANDWMPNLFNNINRMNMNIGDNMNRLNRDLGQNIMSMNQQIQENVFKSVNQMTEQIQRAAAAAAETGDQGISVGQESVIVNSIPGGSRTIVSGYSADGQPYRRDSEEKVIGNILYHTDRIYNPSTGTTNEFRYTIDLSNPSARPVVLTN